MSMAAAEARHVLKPLTSKHLFMLDASFGCLMFTCDVDSSAAAIFCEVTLRESLLTGCCSQGQIEPTTGPHCAVPANIGPSYGWPWYSELHLVICL